MTRSRAFWCAALLGSMLTLLGSGTASRTASDKAGKTRTYYLAADEVAWDYVPGGVDEIAGRAFADTGFFQNAPPQLVAKDRVQRPVSTTYRKALYREYTDTTFQTLKPRPPRWEHLGFLGPVMHAEVGETIRVVFRNNAHHPFSVHPHGVFYKKDSEGALYNDGTAGADKTDDAVPPGGTHVYTWPVPERAGPGPGDPSSIMWMYHSHTDEVQDVNTGLLGVIIITARGKARPDGTPIDVDRELVTAFIQVHEENSWYAEQNLPPTLDQDGPIPSPRIAQMLYPYFVTFSVNGFARGSLPLQALTVRKGERVRWYVFGATNDFDFHTPHWHGNTVLINHMRTDVGFVAPMGMVVADMVPDNVGTWLYHCHVSFHLIAGMQARYAVVE